MTQLTATAASIPTQNEGTVVIKTLSHLCFAGGFVSILASILVWVFYNTPDSAHGERFAIFVGLWAPTFFALSDRLDRYVNSRRA